jgi:hypothetical protein
LYGFGYFFHEFHDVLQFLHLLLEQKSPCGHGRNRFIGNSLCFTLLNRFC